MLFWFKIPLVYDYKNVKRGVDRLNLNLIWPNVLIFYCCLGIKSLSCTKMSREEWTNYWLKTFKLSTWQLSPQISGHHETMIRTKAWLFTTSMMTSRSRISWFTAVLLTSVIQLTWLPRKLTAGLWKYQTCLLLKRWSACQMEQPTWKLQWRKVKQFTNSK